jgi:adenylate cyclase
MADDGAPLRLVDWSLDEVLVWLRRDGRLQNDLAAFFGELVDRLQAAGAPVWRLYLGLQTIHPQLRAMGVVWRRGEGISEVARRYGIEITSAYIGSPIQAVREQRKTVRYRLDALTEQDHEVLREVAAEGGTDYLAFPVPVSRGEWPVLTIATDRAGGFGEADVLKFTTLVEYLGAVVEMHIGHRVTTTVLDTYLGRETGERILRGLIRRGDGEEIRAVLWFSDLRNYTGLSEVLSSEQVMDILNFHFETLGKALARHGGQILKFMGDGVLAIFPIREAMFVGEACTGALQAALDAQAEMDMMNSGREAAEQPPIRFGIGLHIGTVTYGNIGTEDRLDFTVIGPAVNRCARLQVLTKEAGVSILASAAFHQSCPRPLRSVGRFVIRGVDEMQEVFTPLPDLKN